MSRKNSPIWQVPKDTLEQIVKDSKTFSEVLRYLGYKKIGDSANTLKKRLAYSEISYDHFDGGRSAAAVRIKNIRKRSRVPLLDLLVEGSTISSRDLKLRLWEEGVLETRCVGCGLTEYWNGSVITLQLDHINGISDDNQLHNLRILCPNCHSQTPTYAGKGRKKKLSCTGCLKSIASSSSTLLCRSCAALEASKHRSHYFTRKVVARPSLKELRELLGSSSYCAVGRMYGVTDNAIRKWFKLAGEEPPKKQKSKKVRHNSKKTLTDLIN
jgi:5-methylcytosine-specific restriction endonuclease McrA